MIALGEETLFGEEGGDGQPRAAAPPRPYVLTNQNNLYEFLSWDRVAPRESFTGEYYADLSVHAPGRVVLLGVPAGPAVQSEVTRDGANLLPIAMELAGPVRSTPVPALARGGESGGGAVVRPGEAMCWAPATTLPIGWFSRLCFRTQEEVDEFEARQSLYPNLDLMTLPRVVDPDFFTDEEDELDGLLAFLHGLEPGGASPEIYEAMDRTDGLFAVLLAALPPDPSSFAVAADALVGYTKGGKGAKARQQTSLEKLAQKLPKAKTEKAIAKACSEVLSAVQPSREWRPSEILDELVGAIDKTDLSARDSKAAAAMLDRTRKVLSADEPFVPRKEGFATLRALELALIRKDPESFLGWPAEETGASGEVRMLGAAMVGLMAGFKRLSLGLKSPSLRRLLSLNAAHPGVWGDPLLESQKFEIVVDQPRETGPSTQRLLWEEEVLAEQVIEKASLGDLVADVDFASDFGVSLGFEIARRMKWRDCVVTEISFKEGSITTGAAGTVVEVEGAPTIRRRVIPDRLLHRLSTEEIPPELDALIRSQTAASGS